MINVISVVLKSFDSTRDVFFKVIVVVYLLKSRFLNYLIETVSSFSSVSTEAKSIFLPRFVRMDGLK